MTVLRNDWSKLVKSILFRRMSTHMEKTRNISRNTEITHATVLDIYKISPSIKKLEIHVHNKDFVFKAGQWVDFVIPGISTIGGFSMCSAPKLLNDQRILHLAVKYSSHPPAHWIHDTCKPGDNIAMRCGGPFYHDTHRLLSHNVLLIAAGVGISPMLSIYLDIFDSHELLTNKKKMFGKTSILYTAISEEELVFKETIMDLSKKNNSMDYKLFSTKVASCKDYINNRRLNKEDIIESISNLSEVPSNVITYICGPNPMMEEMSDILLKCGVLQQNIRYEKWW